MILKNIFCFGDSLTFGARDQYHRGYPANLSYLFQKYDNKTVHCFNSGVSGETSGMLLKRSWVELSKLLALNIERYSSIALLMIGTNDTMLRTPVDIYRDNVRQIVSLLLEHFAHVGVGLLPPIYGPGLCNYPRDAQKWVDSYNESLVFADSRVFKVDFRNMHDSIVDTVHFDNPGYIAMADIWYREICKSIVIED